MADKDMMTEAEVAMAHGRSVDGCSVETFDSLCRMARGYATEMPRLEAENERLKEAMSYAAYRVDAGHFNGVARGLINAAKGIQIDTEGDQ